MANDCLRQQFGIENLRRGIGMPEAEAVWRHVARHPDMSNVVVAILWKRFQTQKIFVTDESIVCVDFTDMPVRVWISPNKRFSPFCVGFHYRFSWARLWLGKRSAYKERPFCIILTTSPRQHNDTVHWSISTRGCGCASFEDSWQHRGDVSEWFMQKT